MAIASSKSQAQTQQVISHHDLYEQDFCLWIEQAVKLLSENRLSELDRENLIEEIGFWTKAICLINTERSNISPTFCHGYKTHIILFGNLISFLLLSP
ncbi:MAG: DUF29 family protein [Pseudanabaena sp. ELA645]|jgi:hypothetical protein